MESLICTTQKFLKKYQFSVKKNLKHYRFQKEKYSVEKFIKTYKFIISN